MKIVIGREFDFKPRTQVYDHETIDVVRGILNDIQSGKASSVLEYAKKFKEIAPDQSIFVDSKELKHAYDTLTQEDRDVLSRVASRIRAFAQAQLDSVQNLVHPVEGGFVGHTIMPMEVAGCYAPGGRFPLPSSVLMTVIPARVAGVKTVCLASPKPTQHTLAAAYIAGVDVMLRIGGAQAIGAMAYGIDNIPAADIIVGPGNRYVTAAKQIVSSQCAIDLPAGPSELAILADETADPKTLAADLLAQAEHDTDAWPLLISPSRLLIDSVEAEIKTQLSTLSTAAIASVSLSNGLAIHVDTMEEALKILNHLAMEHVEIICKNAQELAKQVMQGGGLFIGRFSAEVIGDYGVGPNHTLPTGGCARHKAGLSVFNFLRMRTWIDIEDPEAAQQIYRDSASLARIEGLEAHARAAETRLKG